MLLVLVVMGLVEQVLILALTNIMMTLLWVGLLNPLHIALTAAMS